MDNKIDAYYNPILSGFYPDPSICKSGKDFYLINSTFAYYPGIPVFHSRDLVTWNQIGNVISRPDQLEFHGLGVSRAIFAPAIRYNNGVFYVTCTLIDGKGNFVMTAENPAGPWSDPVWLPEIRGIDPSLFFDDDGKAYIIYNSDPPENKSLYDGHRTIRINEFDFRKLKVISDNHILVNGGVDISKEPVWIEGPHIFKVNGYYYLSAAEGGTCINHSQVVLRSNNIKGPYIPYEKNPILTQRHLDPKRKFPVTSTGHADYVELDNGNWWAIFLGCRPYEPVESDMYNTGRETFLAPVKWIDGWPVINPDYEEVQYSYPLPLQLEGKQEIPLNGNFLIREDFDDPELDLYWLFLRSPKEKWYDLSVKKSHLMIKVRPETVSGISNPSFIGRRQQHIKCQASISMDFRAHNAGEKSGLILYQGEKYFYFICKSKKDQDDVIELYKSNKDKNMELIAERKIDDSENITTFLKVVINGKDFKFYYSEKPDEWKILADNVDGTFLSVKNAGGFVGTIIAMYATSSGETTGNTAYFDWFEYIGDDEVYRKL